MNGGQGLRAYGSTEFKLHFSQRNEARFNWVCEGLKEMVGASRFERPTSCSQGTQKRIPN